MLTSFYKWNQRLRVIMIGNYLEDDTLNWFIENYDNCNFDELETKFIARFGVETVDPIVEFFNLKYHIKTGIKEYFESKRFGILAKLTEQQISPIMTQGLHSKMIESFVTVKPKTCADKEHHPNLNKGF
jgi:wyosine [tRNA(Phe)-imidazoG37] synthetase (radical SAM superfamily)